MACCRWLTPHRPKSSEIHFGHSYCCWYYHRCSAENIMQWLKLWRSIPIKLNRGESTEIYNLNMFYQIKFFSQNNFKFYLNLTNLINIGSPCHNKFDHEVFPVQVSKYFNWKRIMHANYRNFTFISSDDKLKNFERRTFNILKYIVFATIETRFLKKNISIVFYRKVIQTDRSADGWIEIYRDNI